MFVCVLSLWGLVGYLRFELSYAKEGISVNLMLCLW